MPKISLYEKMPAPLTTMEQREILGSNCILQSSPIHGKGSFLNKSIQRGESIFKTTRYLTYYVPVFGSVQYGPFKHLYEPFLIRWVNHSCIPNARIEFQGDELMLISIGQIMAGEEITCDYRSTEEYIPYPFECNCGHCDGILIS